MEKIIYIIAAIVICALGYHDIVSNQKLKAMSERYSGIETEATRLKAFRANWGITLARDANNKETTAWMRNGKLVQFVTGTTWLGDPHIDLKDEFNRAAVSEMNNAANEIEKLTINDETSK